MENNEIKHNTESMKTANQAGIYKLIIFGVLVCMVGTYLRFAFDSSMLSLVSWIILFIGAIISIKGVFKILDAQYFSLNIKACHVKNHDRLFCFNIIQKSKFLCFWVPLALPFALLAQLKELASCTLLSGLIYIRKPNYSSAKCNLKAKILGFKSS